MKRKIFIPILCAVLALGILSGCEEEVANKAPVASFSYSPMEMIYADTMITFTDTSTDEDGTIESWSWDFGDDMTSTEQNPTHSYDTIGTYTVTLIVTDNDGNTSDPYSMDVTVSVVPPTAMFTYEPMMNITVNVTTIEFTDTSTMGDANITSWMWDFGDGTNSTEQNPTYMYNTTGNFTISLTVTDANGETDTYEATIEVMEEE